MWFRCHAGGETLEKMGAWQVISSPQPSPITSPLLGPKPESHLNFALICICHFMVCRWHWQWRWWGSGFQVSPVVSCCAAFSTIAIIQKTSPILMISPERHHHGQCTPSSHRLTNATIITVDIHPDCFICYVLSTVWTFNLTAAKTSKKSLKLVVLNQNHPMLHPAHITKLSGPIFEKARITKVHPNAPTCTRLPCQPGEYQVYG